MLTLQHVWGNTDKVKVSINLCFFHFLKCKDGIFFDTYSKLHQDTKPQLNHLHYQFNLSELLFNYAMKNNCK